jgi:hypothetical protein
LNQDSNDECFNKKPSDNTLTKSFVPNYLANPEFLYAKSNLFTSYTSKPDETQLESNNKIILEQEKPNKYIPQSKSNNSIMSVAIPEVITIRLKANLDEDFIEIDIDKLNMSFEEFKEICYKELDHIDRKMKIFKIRKLPNILIRNTNDIKRLKNEQEIQVIFI